MSEDRPPKLLICAADRAGAPGMSMQHPLDPDSRLHGSSLSDGGDGGGSQRLGVHLLRILPGKKPLGCR